MKEESGSRRLKSLSTAVKRSVEKKNVVLVMVNEVETRILVYTGLILNWCRGLW